MIFKVVVGGTVGVFPLVVVVVVSFPLTEAMTALLRRLAAIVHRHGPPTAPTNTDCPRWLGSRNGRGILNILVGKHCIIVC